MAVLASRHWPLVAKFIAHHTNATHISQYHTRANLDITHEHTGEMVSTSTNSTPTSCEDAVGDDSAALPTPTKFIIDGDSIHQNDDVDTAADLSPSNTFASTPSSSPTNDARGGGNNPIIQDRTARSTTNDNDLAESVSGLRKLEGKEAKHDLSRVLFGCMFAYVILGIWIYTIIKLLVVIKVKDCVDVYEAELEGDSNDVSVLPCLDLFTGKLACAHSIAFGLISAVVIQETGSSDDSASAMQRLSSITQPILKRRQANANIFQRAVFSVIVSLPAVYVVSWTVFGLWCFIYSISTPDGSSGPLFYTGQTWLGITIRASYTFLGLVRVLILMSQVILNVLNRILTRKLGFFNTAATTLRTLWGMKL